MSHIIDLVRCKEYCDVVIPIHTAHANYNTEFNIISDFAIELCRVTGDRVMISQFIDSQTRNIKNNARQSNYNNKFYNNSTDVATCISSILDIVTPYTNEMIADIEENYKIYNFTNFDMRTHLIIPRPIPRPRPAPAPAFAATATLPRTTVPPGLLPVVTGGGKFDETLETDQELDVDSAIMSTSNQMIVNRFFVPRKYVDEYKKLYPEFTIIPNLSEFIDGKFDSSFDFYDYVNKRIAFYTEKGFDLYDDIVDKKLEIDSIELVNPISNEEYIKMLNKFKKRNDESKLYKGKPAKIIGTIPQRPTIMAFGGSDDKFYLKYLKYKQKYLELKNKK